MKRINIHPSYIKLISNIQNNRSNTVQTYFGQTEGYQVEDGLDQGEVNAPIHWWIFYDPLLAEIKSQRLQLGYSINTKWKNHPNDNSNGSISSQISACAFVDDTIWCVPSRAKMQTILDLASEFYKMNDIEINTQKSAAVIINSKNTAATLTLQNKTVPILAPGKETRYLGIYVLSEGINKPTITKVEEEIHFIT